MIVVSLLVFQELKSVNTDFIHILTQPVFLHYEGKTL